MRALPLAAFAFAATISAQASAQEPSPEPSAREAQKAACQQEANLIYRTGRKGIGMGRTPALRSSPLAGSMWGLRGAGRPGPRLKTRALPAEFKPRRPRTLP
jgi:hypothetical protein